MFVQRFEPLGRRFTNFHYYYRYVVDADADGNDDDAVVDAGRLSTCSRPFTSWARGSLCTSHWSGRWLCCFL